MFYTTSNGIFNVGGDFVKQIYVGNNKVVDKEEMKISGNNNAQYYVNNYMELNNVTFQPSDAYKSFQFNSYGILKLSTVVESLRIGLTTMNHGKDGDLYNIVFTNLYSKEPLFSIKVSMDSHTSDWIYRLRLRVTGSSGQLIGEMTGTIDPFPDTDGFYIYYDYSLNNLGYKILIAGYNLSPQSGIYIPLSQFIPCSVTIENLLSTSNIIPLNFHSSTLYPTSIYTYRLKY